MKIFLSSAGHFEVPGLLIKAHATRALAVAECVDNINIMLRDHKAAHGGKLRIATADNWEKQIAFLQDYHGAQYCYCEIEEMPVNGTE